MNRRTTPAQSTTPSEWDTIPTPAPKMSAAPNLLSQVVVTWKIKHFRNITILHATAGLATCMSPNEKKNWKAAVSTELATRSACDDKLRLACDAIQTDACC